MIKISDVHFAIVSVVLLLLALTRMQIQTDAQRYFLWVKVFVYSCFYVYNLLSILLALSLIWGATKLNFVLLCCKRINKSLCASCDSFWIWTCLHCLFAFTASTRRTVHNKTPADDEDEDEDFGDDDSFINDDSEDGGDDSDYLPPNSDDSGKEDIKQLQKEAKGFLKRRKWTHQLCVLVCFKAAAAADNTGSWD